MVAVASGRGYRDSAGRNIHTSFSAATFDAFRSRTQTLSGLAAFQSIGELNVAAGGKAETATGQLVSGDYYRTLGVQSVLGRTITSDDDRPGAAPVAVLNYRYWQRRFGLDPEVLGKTLVVNAVPFTVIGVTPAQFSGTEIFEAPDIFLP